MSIPIRIFDTTLRDDPAGAARGISIERRVSVARMLEAAGVACIEAGCPAQSPGEKRAVEAVAAAMGSAEVAALVTCRPDAVAEAVEALRPAAKPVIHVVLTADQSAAPAARTDVCRVIRESVTCARTAGAAVQFTLARIEEIERPFRRQCIGVAVEAGATRIGVPDSTGALDTGAYAALVRDIAEYAGPHVMVSANCCNASGRAVANAMAAAVAGAVQLETSVGGSGPYGGNAATEVIAQRLHKLSGRYPVDLNAVRAAGDLLGSGDVLKTLAMSEERSVRSTAAETPAAPAPRWRCRVEVAAL